MSELYEGLRVVADDLIGEFGVRAKIVRNSSTYDVDKGSYKLVGSALVEYDVKAVILPKGGESGGSDFGSVPAPEWVDEEVIANAQVVLVSALYGSSKAVLIEITPKDRFLVEVGNATYRDGQIITVSSISPGGWGNPVVYKLLVSFS